MIELEKLPKGWTIAKLGELCKLKNGFAFKKNDYKSSGVPLIRIGNINHGLVTIDNSVKVDNKEIYKDYIINQGDILIAMSGATTGKFGIYNSQELAYQNQRVGKFEFLDKHSINEKLLFYFLFLLKGEILKDSYGGAQPNISSSKIEDFPVPLVPLNEQKRILAKLEQLLTDLDKGIEYLETTKQQLKVYRQAVLKWAFEGKLTNKDVKDGELPKGWEPKKVSELCDVVRGGSPRPAGDPKFYNGNIPFLKVADLTNDNSVYLHSYEFTIKEAGLQKTRKIYPETLLLTNSGATLGVPKICMIEATMNDGIAAFLNLDKRSNLYLYYYWESKTQQLRNINQGAAQPNLNTDIIKNYIVPYGSFEQQSEVVKAIESRLSVCDKIEETIESSIQQADALRLSIIKKAFEGKLVPQDPNDEPAEKLLERIREAKGNGKPEKKGKEAKTKKSPKLKHATI